MRAGRNLVLTVSIGHRPWFPLLRPYMESYARRWGADFEVITRTQHGPDLDLSIRQEKIASVHGATARYERVLLIDDTIFVRPDAPLLLAPELARSRAPICATLETHIPGWETMLADAFDYYEVPLREWTFLNSGVMLVSHEHHTMFDLSKTKPLKKIGYFVDQMWINVMRQKHGFPVHDIGPSYNFAGSFLVGTTPPPLSLDQVYFFHLTRAVGGNDERLQAARSLLQQFG